METLRSLFLKNQNYIIEVNLNESQYLFIEGLDENGCTNTNKCFDIKNIKLFCIELFARENGDVEYIDGVDSCGITLDDTIDKLKLIL